MILRNSQILLSIIALLLSILAPLNVLNAKPEHSHQEQEMEKIEPGHDHPHHHSSLDISAHTNVPQVKIQAYQDTVKGWNLNIQTSNFTFTPENLGKSSNPNQGHAHLFINGKKVGRIYSNWHYIAELSPGENEIKVTLNTDNHEDLLYQGTIIGDRIMINNN